MKELPLLPRFLNTYSHESLKCVEFSAPDGLLKNITQYPPSHYATYQGPHYPGGVDKFVKTRKFVFENVGNQH